MVLMAGRSISPRRKLLTVWDNSSYTSAGFCKGMAERLGGSVILGSVLRLRTSPPCLRAAACLLFCSGSWKKQYALPVWGSAWQRLPILLMCWQRGFLLGASTLFISTSSHTYRMAWNGADEAL